MLGSVLVLIVVGHVKMDKSIALSKRIHDRLFEFRYHPMLWEKVILKLVYVQVSIAVAQLSLEKLMKVLSSDNIDTELTDIEVRVPVWELVNYLMKEEVTSVRLMQALALKNESELLDLDKLIKKIVNETA
jgi:hypothetical protein